MRKHFAFFPALLLALILTCAVYPQEAGTIIFSKTMINPSNPTDLTTTFKAGDNIYAVAYVNQNLIDMFNNDNPKKMDAEITLYDVVAPLYDYQQATEMQMEFSIMWIYGDAMSKKYLLVDIVPDKNSMTAYTEEYQYEKFGDKFYGPVRFALALAKLTPGKHEIVVRFKFNYKDVANGKFTIEGTDFSVYKPISKELNTAADVNKTKSTGFPKALITDKKLEGEMISVLKGSQTYKDRIKGDVVKIVITDSDWYIRRNDLTGIILNRYIRATVGVKDKDGKCTVWPIVYIQNYIGNKFDKTKFDGVGDPYKIPCENIK